MKQNFIFMDFIPVITEIEGFDPQIGHLVAMMEITRIRTTSEIKNLSVEQLDFRFTEGTNSIGTLLKHIAAMEAWYQAITFEGRDLNDQEKQVWRGALSGELSLGIIKENPVGYYTKVLSDVRTKTLSELGTRKDDWLYEMVLSDSNNYYKWFHVMEDEISHRGQIIWLKKRMKELGL